jgi:RNA polymerase sigma factor (sigma-70 family)
VTTLDHRLVRLALLLSGGRADAEDVVAEAASRVYVRWRQGRVDDLGAYLRTAVVHEVQRRGRRQGLERRVRDRRTADGRATTPLDERISDRDVVLEALRQLGPRQRQAVVLRYLEDLSVEETAAAMQISTGTVKSQAARGLRTLRELLGERDSTSDEDGDRVAVRQVGGA